MSSSRTRWSSSSRLRDAEAVQGLQGAEAVRRRQGRIRQADRKAGGWDTIPRSRGFRSRGSLLSAMIGKACVHPHDAAAHEQLKVKVPLDPTTEYLLDIVADPSIGPPTQPLFRAASARPYHRRWRCCSRRARRADRRSRSPTSARSPCSRLRAGGEGGDTRPGLPGAAPARSAGATTRPSQPRRTVLWQAARCRARRRRRPAGDAGTPVAVPRHPRGARGRGRRRASWLEPEGVARGGRLPRRGRVRPLDRRRADARAARSQIAVVGGNVSLSLRRIHHPMFEGAVGLAAAPGSPRATLAPRATWEERREPVLGAPAAVQPPGGARRLECRGGKARLRRSPGSRLTTTLFPFSSAGCCIPRSACPESRSASGGEPIPAETSRPSS